MCAYNFKLLFVQSIRRFVFFTHPERGGEVAGSRAGLAAWVDEAATGHLATGFLAYPQHSVDYVHTPGSTAPLRRASDRHRSVSGFDPPTCNLCTASSRHRLASPHAHRSRLSMRQVARAGISLGGMFESWLRRIKFVRPVGSDGASKRATLRESLQGIRLSRMVLESVGSRESSTRPSALSRSDGKLPDR